MGIKEENANKTGLKGACVPPRQASFVAILFCLILLKVDENWTKNTLERTRATKKRVSIVKYLFFRLQRKVCIVKIRRKINKY